MDIITSKTVEAEGLNYRLLNDELKKKIVELSEMLELMHQRSDKRDDEIILEAKAEFKAEIDEQRKNVDYWRNKYQDTIDIQKAYFNSNPSEFTKLVEENERLNKLCRIAKRFAVNPEELEKELTQLKEQNEQLVENEREMRNVMQAVLEMPFKNQHQREMTFKYVRSFLASLEATEVKVTPLTPTIPPNPEVTQ